MNESDFMLKSVHEEFAKRVDEENTRQNHRISELERGFMSLSKITTSVEKLAINMEHMVTEQKSQGSRLEALENRDGEMWRKVVSHIVTTGISLVLGYLVGKFGGM